MPEPIRDPAVDRLLGNGQFSQAQAPATPGEPIMITMEVGVGGEQVTMPLAVAPVYLQLQMLAELRTLNESFRRVEAKLDLRLNPSGGMFNRRSRDARQ